MASELVCEREHLENLIEAGLGTECPAGRSDGRHAPEHALTARERLRQQGKRLAHLSWRSVPLSPARTHVQASPRHNAHGIFCWIRDPADPLLLTADAPKRDTAALPFHEAVNAPLA